MDRVSVVASAAWEAVSVPGASPAQPAGPAAITATTARVVSLRMVTPRLRETELARASHGVR
jgi:hypothetical protein